MFQLMFLLIFRNQNSFSPLYQIKEKAIKNDLTTVTSCLLEELWEYRCDGRFIMILCI